LRGLGRGRGAEGATHPVKLSGEKDRHRLATQKAKMLTEGDLHQGSLMPSRQFVDRHIGPDETQIQQMLATLGVASLYEMMD